MNDVHVDTYKFIEKYTITIRFKACTVVRMTQRSKLRTFLLSAITFNLAML